MNAVNKKIIILNFQKESDQSATLRSLEKMYEKHANVDVQVVANGTEAAQLAKMYQGGLFLFSVFDKRDVAQILTFISGATQELQDGTIKMAGYNNLDNKKLEKYLSQNGCAEEFYGRLTPKTLGYKMTLWFKAIDFAASKVEERKKKEEEAKATEIRFIESMKLASDCWILNNKDDIHNSLRQWFIDIIGPSPCAGKWIEIENKKDHYDKYWEWKPKMEQEFPFVTDLGQWIYKGIEPKFSWKSNSWQFTGKDIYLGFYHQDSEKIDYRFIANQSGAEIAENSSAALSKRTMIYESCDPKYHMDAEDLYQRKDAHFEREKLQTNLQGNVENSGESIDGLLRGQQQGKANQSGHYKGQLQKDHQTENNEEDTDFDPLKLEAEINQLNKQKALDSTNRLDNRLKGKVGDSLALDLEKSDADDGNGDTGRSPRIEKDSSRKPSTTLDFELQELEREKENTESLEKTKRELSSRVNLDIMAAQEKRAKDQAQEALKNPPKTTTKIDLETQREELERQLEDEKKKLAKKSILDLGLPKHDENGPTEGQVDHLQKYYGFVHEMGLDPSLTSNDDLRDAKEEDESRKKNKQNNIQPQIELGKTADSDTKANAAKKTSASSEKKASVELSPTDPTNGDKTANHANGKGQLPQSSLGHKEKTANDLDGQGSRAEYIEKYYGTKRHLTEDEAHKERNKERRERDQNSARTPLDQNENKPLTLASEIDLFNGDRVNLQDIKLLIQIIRKGKSTGIFDDSSPVELSDLFDNYMVVNEQSEKQFDAGERVLIKVDCSYLGRNNFYDFFGTVAEVEEIDEEEASSKNLCVELTKFEKKNLDEISRVFLERQANIIKFFKAAKGLG